MVTKDEKLNKFHLAINQYAEEQRKKIEEEVESFKQKELEEAESEVLSEAYRLIQNEMVKMRDTIAREMAQREIDNRRALLKRRRAIMEDVFSRANASLQEFVKSEQYANSLEKFAKNLSEVFGDKGATFCMRSADQPYEALVARAFGKPCTFKTDDSIRIGGIRAFDPATGLEADETLDAMLNDQYAWFEENSGLALSQDTEGEDGPKQ